MMVSFAIALVIATILAVSMYFAMYLGMGILFCLLGAATAENEEDGGPIVLTDTERTLFIIGLFALPFLAIYSAPIALPVRVIESYRN
jgi:hypothetical protein